MEPWGEDNDIVVKLVASSASSKPHSTLASSSGPRQRVAPQRAKDVPSCPKGCACTSCRWPSEGASLEREFRLSDGVDPSVIMGLSGAQAILAKGSWCQTKQGPDGKLRLGCIACAALPSDRTATSKVRLWATSQACSKTLTRWRMRRHANSQVHKAAVLHLLGVEVGPTGGCVAGAPPLDEFQALLAHMGEGESERASARRQTNNICSTKTESSWLVRRPLSSAETNGNLVCFFATAPAPATFKSGGVFWARPGMPEATRVSWSTQPGRRSVNSAPRSGLCQLEAVARPSMTRRCSATSRTMSKYWSLTVLPTR